MSMSMRVVGLVPVDDKWRAMKALWDSCYKLKIAPPKEVIDFFNEEYPEEENAVVVDITHTDYYADMGEGFEVSLDDLPKDVKKIRFYCS